jgi:hypothetical protein
MMFGRTGIAAIALTAGILAGELSAQQPVPNGFYGGIVGLVSNSSGIPQMGATVQLFDELERAVSHSLTDQSGGFLFQALPPGPYSLRVSLASFLPAWKRNILVQPGMRSLLSVNLAGALSTIELVYTSPSASSIMSDDWKWVLRASTATRPVLRFRQVADISVPVSSRTPSTAAFSDTRGIVKISAGDEGRISQLGNEPDLGTAFALATSIFGVNQLQVSGNFAYSAATGVPAAGFRTSYSRGAPGDASSPQVNLTMRQVYMRARAGTGLLTGQEEAAPALRTMSAGFLDHRYLSDALRFEYGFSLESVSFLDTLNYFSPFGRLTYDLGEGESLEFAFSSGAPPAELLSAPQETGNEMQRDLSALALFPRVSLRNGRATVQRSGNLELAYRRMVGSRTFSLAGYQETVRNAALTMVAPAGSVPSSEYLPDLVSNSAVFNAGDYVSLGYMVSVTQSLLDRLNVTLAGGSGNALIPGDGEVRGDRPEELRAMLHRGQRRWLALIASGSIARIGTQCTASYRWSDGNSLTAGHLYLTQTLRPDVGWNIYVRQPVPAFPGLRGRLEATADLRNLLAEGYLPLATADGGRILLLHTPRSMRGGFAFVF